MKRDSRILAAAVLLALSPLAGAQTPGITTPTASTTTASTAPGQVQVAGRLATSFTGLAGSQENALALVNALRYGTEVTLLAPAAGGTGDPVATTFAPPTKPMGWGNVSHSLSLAQSLLAQQGITSPANADLQAALMGGDVIASDGSTVTLDGILTMRASGMGWGQIAKASGTTMGAVASSTKAMQGKPVATASTSGTVTTAAGSAKAAGPASSRGIGTAAGLAPAASSRGLVTAEGAIAGAGAGRAGGLTTGATQAGGGGNAYGRGLVTASGGSAGAGVAAASSHGRGAGLVSASGAAAGSGAAVTTAAGPGNGHGNGKGNGNGKGGG